MTANQTSRFAAKKNNGQKLILVIVDKLFGCSDEQTPILSACLCSSPWINLLKLVKKLLFLKYINIFIVTHIQKKTKKLFGSI